MDNSSACHPTDEDLDVKLPATTKADDVLLEDLVPTTNRVGVGEQLNVSQDLNNFHVFKDDNKMTSNENNEQEPPKMMEVRVGNQQKDAVIESELVPRTTTKMVNLNHMKEFQECVDSYEIGNGVHLFDMIVLAIAFYESTCNVHLIVTKSSAHDYQQYSCKQHSESNFCVSFGHHCSTGLLHMKKCNFFINGFTTETTLKVGGN